MAQELAGRRVAALVTDGFEQVELIEPRRALEEAGAQVEVVSPKEDEVRGWDHREWGANVRVDRPLAEARPDDYDALLLPGGVMNPDKLRMDRKAVDFIRAFVDAGKPIASICHGPWPLIEAGAVKGRRMTSYPSLRTDLRNAGAEWVDEEVVVDRNLVTSRNPGDIPAFNQRMVELFAQPARPTAARGAGRTA
ncbi:MAG TPA: type 1 glutamine amidotransferase domain-containing protein [Vicinamibacterales bacterium]